MTKATLQIKKSNADNHLLSQVQEIINNRISIDGKNNFKFIYDQNTRDRLLMLYYQNDNRKAMYANYAIQPTQSFY